MLSDEFIVSMMARFVQDHKLTVCRAVRLRGPVSSMPGMDDAEQITPVTLENL